MMLARCVRDRVLENKYLVYMPTEATFIRSECTVHTQTVTAGHSAGGERTACDPHPGYYTCFSDEDTCATMHLQKMYYENESKTTYQFAVQTASITVQLDIQPAAPKRRMSRAAIRALGLAPDGRGVVARAGATLS